MDAQAFFVLNVKSDFMKKILFCFLLFCTSSCLKKQPEISLQSEEKTQPSNEFVQGSEDIPLLKGMEKSSEETFGFDSRSGSILTSEYVTKNSFKAVKKFYSQTLPQMGWKLHATADHQITFKREKEKLEIEFKQNGKQNKVKFFYSSSF